MDQSVAIFVAALFGLFIQYLVITVAVRHGVVSAQRVLDKAAEKAAPNPPMPRHQKLGGLNA